MWVSWRNTSKLHGTETSYVVPVLSQTLWHCQIYLWLWFYYHWAHDVVDAGPIGFHSEVTTNRGPWPGPRAGARRGAASATPTPSRIGQTSRIPIESTFCI
jgi:hypothetical protein